MEIEEAKMILERMIPKPSRGNGKLDTIIMITEALNLAIKSLEQIERTETILDDIRAEICQSKIEHKMEISWRDKKNKMLINDILLINDIYRDIVNILDRYRTESEFKDNHES